MYCPKCAAQNVEGARFCRVCGADISLIPQALTGQLPTHTAVVGYDRQGHPINAQGRRIRKAKEPPSLEKGITKSFMGAAFFLIAISVMLFAPGGRMWWFWMLIPAFSMLGSGVAEILRLKNEQRLRQPSHSTGAPTPPQIPAPSVSSASQPNALPHRRNTAELVPPPSVTEGTTQLLDTPVEKSHQDV
jgi:hypothetical protein